MKSGLFQQGRGTAQAVVLQGWNGTQIGQMGKKGFDIVFRVINGV